MRIIQINLRELVVAADPELEPTHNPISKEKGVVVLLHKLLPNSLNENV